jgi:hypothetical protein
MEWTTQLSGHCIQTEIKRRSEKAISRYFKKEGHQEEIETEIEYLHILLEHLDFGSLRAEYPALAGGTEALIRVVCQQEESGVRIVLWIDESKVMEEMVAG